MRLALLTHEPFYPPSGGGSAEAVYLVEEMVRRGHEVHVFCPRVEDAAAVAGRFKLTLHEFKTFKMGRYASLRNFKYLLYPFLLQRMVESASRQTKFDLLLSQHSISAVAAGRLRARLRVPVVMNYLDYLSGFMETWPAWLMPRPVLARIMNFELSLPVRYKVDGVLTVSDPLADYLAGRGYPKSRILPIYYGYDASLFDGSTLAGSSAPYGRPVVVMHGSFDHHHLGPIAREAVSGVLKARPDVLFRFVGQRTPALIQLTSEIQKIHPAANVECTGFLPYADVARQLAGTAVGIVPYEASRGVHCAFVAKIVEYVGLGLPVVSTPLDGAMRFFSAEPLVKFSGFDGASFCRMILGWLNEPMERRRALAQPAMARVKAELDWRVICRKAIDFVESTQKNASAAHGGA